MSRTKTTSRKRRVKRRIDFPSVEEWELGTRLKHRRTLHNVSLCQLFETAKKQNPNIYIYILRE